MGATKETGPSEKNRTVNSFSMQFSTVAHDVGAASIFNRFLMVAGKCDSCGLDYAGHDAADGPAVFIMMFVGFIVAGLALWMEIAFEPPIWLHLVICVLVILVLSLDALRPLKGLFIGTQYKCRSVDDKFFP